MEYDVLREFAAGLLQALQHTAEAGVVHGAIGPSTVRWNGTSVQLVDFERAQALGERRRPGGSGPERSPEQVQGQGTVDARDDVWAAGLLIWQLSLGPNTEGVQAPAKVQTLLDRVFAPTAVDRPSAREVLMRVDRNRLDLMGSSPDDLLAPGRSAFDEALARKRGDAIHQPEPPTRPTRLDNARNGVPARTSRTTVLLAVGVVVLIVAVVLVLVFG
jgi:serine/threonine protein kinase